MDRHKPEDFFPRCTGPDWGGRATRAEISLDAIAANVEALAGRAGRARLMPVVKADAYGHGSVPVARTALAAGAERLAVYTVEEGLVLRQAGISAPLLVFGPFAGSEVAAIRERNLTPTVTSLEAAEALNDGANRRLPIHVKVDTGLTRAGVMPGDVVPFLLALGRFPSIKIEGLYTHLARADDDRATTAKQLRTFRDLLRALSDRGIRPALLHVANSAGAIYHDQADFHLVRPGISLYGYYPSARFGSGIRLHPALSLLSQLSRVSEVPEGTGVGYGHEYRTRRRSIIGLIPIGYGDGLPRQLGGRATVLVHGLPAPMVGRMSMDQITLDVTDIPDVVPGDEVVLIGSQGKAIQTADDLARCAGTLSYDVLTGILPRVPRIYTRNGSIVGTRTLLGEQGIAARSTCPPGGGP